MRAHRETSGSTAGAGRPADPSAGGAIRMMAFFFLARNDDLLPNITRNGAVRAGDRIARSAHGRLSECGDTGLAGAMSPPMPLSWRFVRLHGRAAVLTGVCVSSMAPVLP